jgi:hypothetical protein
MIAVAPVGLPSLSTTGAVTGTTSRSNQPCAQAAFARSWLRNPNASVSARVIWYSLAIMAAPMNWLVGW